MGNVFISVHGTGDQPPAPAGGEPKWWEPSSEFARELLALAPPGSRLEPFIWTGANDERSRRHGARRLLKRLNALKGETVTLIGHSHGGSLIATTLRFAAAKNVALKHVERWVTVGTPFISMKPRRFPWERYDLFGQSILGLALFLSLASANSLASILTQALWPRAGISLNYGFVAPLAVLALVCFSILHLYGGERRALYSRKSTKRFSDLFEGRWRGVVASHDEATAGLSRLSTIKLKVFDWTLAAPAARFFAAGAWLTLIAIHLDVAFVFEQVDRDFWIFAPLDWFLIQMSDIVGATATDDNPLPSPAREDLLWVSYGLMVFIGLFVVLQSVNLAMRFLLGPFIAGRLNHSLHEAIMTRAYGNTLIGEHAFNAATAPSGAVLRALPLPGPANAALLAFARDHAAQTLGAVHAELFGEADDAREKEILVEALVQRLSWRELVHTSYFAAPESRAHIVNLVAVRTT